MTNRPEAPIHPHTRTHHGRIFVDNYEWLRDKESPETIAYLEAENSFTEAETAHLKELQDNIYEEIRSRTKETDMSVPQRAGNFWYYARTEEGKSYGLSCRVPITAEQDPWAPPELPQDGSSLPGEQVILDLNELALGHDFFSLGASSVTESGRYLAYSTDTAGNERFTLRVKDLETGELLDDRLDDIFYGATWAGETHIFYQCVDEAWRPDSVWCHRLGTPQEDDVRVFYEPDARFSTGIGGSRSERFIFIESASRLTSETWVVPVSDPEAAPEVLWERSQGIEYAVDHAVVAGEDRWIVTHNAFGPNFSIGECAAVTGADLPALTDLSELVAHREDVRIEGVDTYAGHILSAYRSGGIGRAAIMVLDDSGYTEFEELTFEEELYTVSVLGNPEWDAPVIRIAYGSFITPSTLFDVTVATGERKLLKQQEVQGGYEPADYTAYRLWVTARDGAQVPVSVVHRADLGDGPHPTLLYGYGSYESSTDPAFSVARLSLLDRGMVFAVAHVRGGGEMGRGWWEHGKTLEKKNTFTDFIDVADDLLARGLTRRDMFIAEGGSAGGLLMGAVANMGGDRFKAIEAVVPFVDPLTSILMPELPLTVGEWEEWGDPLHDPDVYDYMATYAPYENVEAKDYPNILAVTSINDTRVLYVEPAKWIAKLRATATGGEFLLKTEMAAGHGGVSGRYARWRQTAFEYAWMVNQATGLTQ